MKAESMKNTWDLSGQAHDLEKHPHSIMYALYSDTSKVAPIWTKLSHTAFEGRSRLLGGGYGRKIKVMKMNIDTQKRKGKKSYVN
jgi:hypothetical protein